MWWYKPVIQTPREWRQDSQDTSSSWVMLQVQGQPGLHRTPPFPQGPIYLFLLVDPPDQEHVCSELLLSEGLRQAGILGDPGMKGSQRSSCSGKAKTGAVEAANGERVLPGQG